MAFGTNVFPLVESSVGGHKPMLGELNDYKEKAKCGNSNILRGLICRDLSTRSMWETGGMAYN